MNCIERHIDSYNLSECMKAVKNNNNEHKLFEFLYKKLALLKELGDDCPIRFIFIFLIKALRARLITDYEKVILLGYKFTPYRRGEERTYFDVIWEIIGNVRLDVNRMLDYCGTILYKHFFRTIERYMEIDYTLIDVERYFFLGKIDMNAFMYIYNFLGDDEKSTMTEYSITYIYHCASIECVDEFITLSDFILLLSDAKRFGHNICCLLDKKNIKKIFTNREIWDVWYSFMDTNEIKKINPYIMECVRRHGRSSMDDTQSSVLWCP